VGASRKLQRKLDKKTEKEANKDVSRKMGLFDKLEDHCLVCSKLFDRRNREMVKSWYVTVRGDNVRLYCPTCMNTANKVLDDYKKRLEQAEKDE